MYPCSAIKLQDSFIEYLFLFAFYVLLLVVDQSYYEVSNGGIAIHVQKYVLCFDSTPIQ